MNDRAAPGNDGPADALAGFAQRVVDAEPRQRVLLVGLVTEIRQSDVYRSCMEADFDDGTGRVTLVFFGRTEITGLTPGVCLAVAARLLVHGGRLELLNPSYEFVPAPVIRDPRTRFPPERTDSVQDGGSAPEVSRGRRLSRILVVDDDPALLRVLSMGLGARNHAITTATNGHDALTKIAVDAFDLVVLDLGLPDMDGLEVCRRVREQTDVPIIVLSADATEHRKVAALDGGADDYITKPFGMAELEARVRLAARHWNERSGLTPTENLSVGPLEIDLERHRATYRGQTLELTPREFAILTYLARHPGKVLTHQMILNEVWGPGYLKDVHYLRVYVHRLRKALEDEEGALLRTEPGVGYTLDDSALGS